MKDAKKCYPSARSLHFRIEKNKVGNVFINRANLICVATDCVNKATVDRFTLESGIIVARADLSTTEQMKELKALLASNRGVAGVIFNQQKGQHLSDLATNFKQNVQRLKDSWDKISNQESNAILERTDLSVDKQFKMLKSFITYNRAATAD